MRLCVRSGQELGSKEVAHSCYRGRRLRGGAQRLRRAHLQSVMLAKPVRVAPSSFSIQYRYVQNFRAAATVALGFPLARSNF